jgi:predicted nucleotidyltransferase component of viral defense system
LNPKKPKDVAASVRQRLLNLSRKTGEDFQLLLTRYAIERLLYRLGSSEYAGRFVLKGAVLFTLWTGQSHRPTRDLDLLGFGESSAAAVEAVVRALCSVADIEDGLDFAADTIVVEPIREDQEYGGQRVRLEVRLANARVALQVDVGFGDAITPAPGVVAFPTLLGMPAPQLRAYPRETVVAEKLQALVHLGMANSRMKDFYDLWVLAREFSFAGPLLRDAIAATFARRGTAIPLDPPVALTDAFSRDEAKRKQWTAFLNRSGLKDRGGELEGIVGELAEFLMPPTTAAARGEEFAPVWKPGGPWGAGAEETLPAE